jgi:hypothetical protein
VQGSLRSKGSYNPKVSILTFFFVGVNTILTFCKFYGKIGQMKTRYENINLDELENLTPTFDFTNENVAAYMPHLARGAKSGLVVAASGDHVINAAMNGVRDITAFDIDKYALKYTQKKLNDISLLSYNEFIQKYQPYFYEVGKKNRYMKNEKEYNQAKDAVNDIDLTFLHSPIASLAQKIGAQTFDIGVFSNISSHAVSGPQTSTRYINMIIAPLSQNICKIQAMYHWQTENKYPYDLSFFDKNNNSMNQDKLDEDLVKAIKTNKLKLSIFN